MASYRDGDIVQFVAKRGEQKGKLVKGKVLRTRRMRSGRVGCFIEGLDGFDHGFISLPDIEPITVAVSNPAHGGKTERRRCHLEIDEFGLYAVENGKDILSTSVNPDVQKAFRLMIAGLGNVRIT